MHKDAPLSRRQFLERTAMGAAGLAFGFPSFHRRKPAPDVAPTDELRLVFATDFHARTEWETPVAMRKAAEAMKAANPDLIIFGGDLITDGFQSRADKVEPRWDVFTDVCRSFSCPVYPALGNHDLVAARPEDGSAPSEDPRSTFRSRFGLDKTYYSFRAGPCGVIVLDSVCLTPGEPRYHGRITEPQLAWLKEALAQTPRDIPLILVTHIPFVTSFFQMTADPMAAAPRDRVIVNGHEVLSLFSSHSLALVLQGHMHVAEAVTWQTTTFLTGGAVCGKWWRGAWHGTEEGFMTVAIKDGRVDWQYVDYGWEARRPAGA